MDDRHLRSGLHDISVAETRLSKLDGATGGLVIGGFPVDELAAKATYEEAVYLLRNGRLPTAQELTEFKVELASHRALGDDIRTLLQQAAVDERPAMDALRMGVAALDEQAGSRDETAQRIIATFPTISAAYWRYRQGKDPVPTDDALDHAANYLYMLTGETPTESAVTGLETFLTTIVDHGLNPSTFAARVVASTESDLVSAATAAVGALKGTEHGGRLHPLFEVLQEFQKSDLPEQVLEDSVAAEIPPGFGHSVYQTRDPRAAILFTAAERVCTDDDDQSFLHSVRDYESAATQLLAEDDRHAQVNATVELPTIALLRGIGVPYELFTATFAISRVGGWMAHSVEQLEDNELVRPSSQYIGRTGRSWTPVDRRAVAGETIVQQPQESVSLEPVAETLEALSAPARLEILLVLYQYGDAISYSVLRDATSIDDNGRFNYHLRQLQDYFVDNHEEGYALTSAGETLIDLLIDDDRLLGNWYR